MNYIKFNSIVFFMPIMLRNHQSIISYPVGKKGGGDLTKVVHLKVVNDIIMMFSLVNTITHVIPYSGGYILITIVYKYDINKRVSSGCIFRDY